MNKELKDHWSRVAELGCLISQGPATLHHCHGGSMRQFGVLRGTSQKVSDWLVIPIAMKYHTGDQGVDFIGVETWEKRFGTQVDFIDEVCLALNVNVWKKAGIDREVPFVESS